MNRSKTPSAKASRKKTTTRAPADREQRGIVKRLERKGRTAQLVRQHEYLRNEQKHGRAKELGHVIRGRGDYTMGRNLGSKVGGWIGDKLEGFVRQIFGSGDYEIAGDATGIQRNSLVQGSSIPAMHDASLGAVSIKFHEFIGNIGMTSSFRVTSYPIDVTSSSVFPWISKIAANYQQWELAGAVFFLRTLSSDTSVAPTQGMGAIYGSVRYDTASEVPVSKVDILNSTFSSSAKPSENQAFPIECARNETQVPLLKVLPRGALVSPNDLQMYMMGYLDIATEGAPNPYPEAAELYVTYDIRFYKPRTDDSNGAPLFMLDCKNDMNYPLTPIADTPAVRQPRVNSVGITLATDRKTIYFPLTTDPGTVFLIVYTCIGSMLESDRAVPTIALSGGMVRATVFADQTLSEYIGPANASNTGSPSVGAIGFYRYNGNGTQTTPPSWQISMDGYSPAGSEGATLIVLGVPRSLATGLRSIMPKHYTRREFFQYLCDMVAGRESTFEPPRGLGRLSDWTAALTRWESWPVDKPLPPSASPFDSTFIESLASVSKYVTTPLLEIKTEPAPVSVLRNECTCLSADTSLPAWSCPLHYPPPSTRSAKEPPTPSPLTARFR